MENAQNCSSGRLCAGALGISVGVTSALFMVIFGVVAWHFHVGAQWVSMVSSIYVGFALTAKGIAIGALWSLAEGFVLGFVIGFLYNLVCKCCKCHVCRPRP